MQMPETDNIDYQYAFKKGYRMAIEGKRVTSMPSNIRRDMVMRDYFQQGWEQAIEDVSLANEQANKPEWRKRFVWFMFMVIGGIATASLMIHNIEQEQAKQQALIDNNQPPEVAPKQTTQPASNLPSSQSSRVPETSQIQISEPSLSLLSDNQRNDLALNQQTQPDKVNLPLEPLTTSNIIVSNAQISQNVENKTPVNVLDDEIPKYIRKIYFYTEISNAKGQTIYHRWRTDKEILSTVKLDIESNHFRTWSSKKLSSAWQGPWYLEVLDSDKNVIYRKPFYYGTKK